MFSMIGLIERFDWSGFAILASTQYQYSHTAKILAAVAARKELDVAYFQYFDPMESTGGNSSNIMPHVAQIVDSGTRVVFMLGGCPDGKHAV